MKNIYSSLKILAVFVLAFLLLPRVSNAQNGYILYGFRDVQQSSLLNPAFTSGATTVVGIPLLSNFSTGLYSTSGGLNNFFSKKAGSDSLYLDLSKVINNGKPEDRITNFTDMDILFTGFKVGSTFITLGVRQHIFVQTILDRDLLKLLWYGNSPYENQTLDLSHTAVSENHMIDYHLGISVPIKNKVRVGIRLHLLQGLSDISTTNNGLSLKTVLNNQGEFEIHARTNFLVNTSGLPDSSSFNVGKYLTNFNNLGYAIDLGIDFQATKQLWINASVLDWGKVYYRSNTKSYYPVNDSVSFDGVSVDFINNKDPFKTIGDTLQKLFDIKNAPRNYHIVLPTRFIVGVDYYSKDMRNDFSMLFSGRFFNNYFKPAVSVAYTRFVSGHFSVKANYTWIKDAPMNFGLAMAVNFSPFQLYVYSDNVSGLFRWDQQKYVQIGFGFNIRLVPRKTPLHPESIHNLRPDIRIKPVKENEESDNFD